MSYHFDGEWDSGFLAEVELVAAFRAAIDSWNRRWSENRAQLQLIEVGGLAFVRDTRSCAKEPWIKLTPEQVGALVLLERPRRCGRQSVVPEPLLAGLVDLRLVTEHEGSWLSLVVRPTPVRSAGELRSEGFETLNGLAKTAVVGEGETSLVR
jgi:hypothetical protein